MFHEVSTVPMTAIKIDQIITWFLMIARFTIF
jgi:hypothetical protein